MVELHHRNVCATKIFKSIRLKSQKQFIFIPLGIYSAFSQIFLIHIAIPIEIQIDILVRQSSLEFIVCRQNIGSFKAAHIVVFYWRNLQIGFSDLVYLKLSCTYIHSKLCGYDIILNTHHVCTHTLQCIYIISIYNLLIGRIGLGDT